jgi:hypothetical protein
MLVIKFQESLPVRVSCVMPSDGQQNLRKVAVVARNFAKVHKRLSFNPSEIDFRLNYKI